jgi:hypothetical protein
MKNRMLQLAGALLLCAVIGKYYAVPAIAQVKGVLTLTQDRDSRARNFYQAVLACQNVTNPCQIVFPAVPAGKRLIIEHVSTLSTMPAAGTLADVELRGAAVFQFLPVVAAPGNFGGQFQYTTNDVVLAAYEAGQQPNVDAFAATASPFTVLASISGYMIDLP